MRAISIITLFLFLFGCAHKNQMTIDSPNSINSVQLKLSEIGELQYQVLHNQQVVIDFSTLASFNLLNQADLAKAGRF